MFNPKLIFLLIVREVSSRVHGWYMLWIIEGMMYGMDG